ncbi:serine hydrolase [Microbacter sp. GSS18]|nr:serine hydrolase [Microbacter sp. GSS18]
MAGDLDPVSSELDRAVDELLARHATVGLAVGVIRTGEPTWFRAHGVADVPSQAPITEDTVFRIASITKTLTAISVMQLVERGLIDLDAPANTYLRAYKLVPDDPDWAPATIRHLLTHTAGLGELAHPSGAFRPDFGESVPAGERLPSAGEFYRSALAVRAEPGTRFVYTNHAPTTLGQIVEDVTGTPLAEYAAEHVFGPIGMTSSSLSRTESVAAGLATGYEIGRGGVKRIAERDMVTTGAASAFSTPRDMARYAAVLLNQGRTANGSVLTPDALAAMFAPQFQPDPRIPGMGLGFFRAEIAGHAAVRHQGTHPGFHSELCVVPDAGLAVIAFTNGAEQADLWLPAEVAVLAGRVLGESGARLPAAPSDPSRWRERCGWYRLAARASDIRLRAMLGFGAEVFVDDGRLMVRFLAVVPSLLRGFPLVPADPDDPDVFRILFGASGLQSMGVVFGRTAAGRPCLHLDLMPLTLEKQPARTNPRRWAVAALTAGAVAAAALTGAAVRRRRRPSERATPPS